MAYSIRELDPITTGLLDGEVLFEGVTDTPDTSSRYARKVKAGDLETYFARENSELASKQNVGDAVAAETERAETAEEGLQTAIDAETNRAALAENILTRNKADKIAVPKTLSDAAVGDKLGVVVFDRAQTPAAFTAGSITLQNEAEYALTAVGVFTFTDSSGVTQEIYSPENGWSVVSVDTGDSPVTAETNAEGGIWSLCLWSAETASLQDIKNIADQAKDIAHTAGNNAGAAMVKASEAEDKADAAIEKNTEQDGRLTAIETKNDEQDETVTIRAIGDGTFGTVTATDPLAQKSFVESFVSDHNTDSVAHEDIRSVIPTQSDIETIAGIAIETHNTSSEAHADIRGVLAAMPALPTAQGEYKLVVDAGGVAAWELI
jgi:hypothetical protein